MQTTPTSTDKERFAAEVLTQFDLLHPIHTPTSEYSKTKIQPDPRDSQPTKLTKAAKLRSRLELLVTPADVKTDAPVGTLQPIHIAWPLAVLELHLRTLHAPGFRAEVFRNMIAEPAALRRKIDVAVPESAVVREEDADLADALDLLAKEREGKGEDVEGKKGKSKRARKRKAANAAPEPPRTLADATYPAWAAEVMNHFDTLVNHPDRLGKARAVVAS